MKKIWLLTGIILGLLMLLMVGCDKATDETVTDEVDVVEEVVVDEPEKEEPEPEEEVEEDPSLPYEPGQGIITANGPLQVIDSQLCNEAGEPIQLKGMSSHGLQWSGSMITDGSMSTMANDWGIDIFRGAMYLVEDGYVSDSYKGFNLMRMETALALATQNGVYYMVDWHVHRDKDPMLYIEESKEFFEYMSLKYKHYDNIIYEICNEPNGADVSWADNIKPYAETIIPIIRNNDPDAVIIVGSTSYSQNVNEAADDPLEFDNLLYTLHFYAGTHGQELRDKAIYAMDKGLGIFVTEWGTTAATGSGKIFPDEADVWLDFLDEHMISWCNWSFSDVGEESAALLVNSDPNGNWTEDRLSNSGKYVVEKLKENK